MTRIVRILVAMVLVVAGCGGGGDDGTTTTVVAGGDGATTTSTTTTTSTAAPATIDPGAGSSTDFCAFIREYAENADLSLVGLSAAEFEERFRATLASIEQAARIAPSEIAQDVALFADAFGGFVELLAEYQFNFLALGAAENDPRLTAMEDPALEVAGNRISAFCGFEDGEFIQTPQAGGSGGSGGLPSQSLPDGFPAELVPPNGEVIGAVELPGVGTVVTFDVQSPVDDVIAYYTSVVGPATVELPQPKGALWSGPFQGGNLNIVVGETAPGVTSVSVTFG